MEYLRPDFPELKIKDYQVYEAYRAGVSSQLQKEYGFFARLWCRSTNLVLLALLSDGIAGRQPTVQTVRNPRNPFRFRKEMTQTKGILFAARISILMRWYSLQEYSANPVSKVRLLFIKLQQKLLRPAYQKAADNAPILNRIFLQEWDYVQAVHATQTKDYQTAGRPMSQVFGTLLAACGKDDASMEALRRMGHALGYMIFLIGSVERYAANKQTNSYNIYLKNNLSYETAVENAQRQCYQAASEVVRAYYTLIILFNREIVANILIDGVEKMITNLDQVGKETI